MLATMKTSNPFDAVLTKILAFLSDEDQPGYGTLRTSAAGAEVEVTFKPNDGESFPAFAERVLKYADGAPVEWHIQGRKIPLARVTRTLN